MRTNPVLRKKLVCGIIVLFLGMSIMPIVGSLSMEKHASITSSANELNAMKETGPYDVNWTVNGTMGTKGWYISPINLTCTYDHDAVAGVYYQYAFSNWTLYTEPLTIYTQGIIGLYWYWVDFQGNVHPPHGPRPLKIDYAAPSIDLYVFSMNWLRTEWLLIAIVSDVGSGVAKVEFWVDDVLVGNATTLPFEFNYHCCSFSNHQAQAIAYDNAGNYGLSDQILPLNISPQSQIQNNFNVQQNIVLFHNILYNFLLHHQMNRKNQ